MIIGFTGTQDGMTDAQAEAFEQLLRSWLPPDGRAPADWEFHHGDCVGGDKQAHDIVRKLGRYPDGIKIVGHPPTDPVKRAFCDFDEERAPAPYLARNAAIVIASTIMIATPAQVVEQRRSGTWSTIRCARMREKRPLVIVQPDGVYVTENWG